MTRADCAAVERLLTKGFASWRDAAFWRRALDRLAERMAPAGLPQFGYVLDVSGTVVGVLLLIASEWLEAGKPVRRCNVSSWYVEPAFRLYGSLLVRRALRHRDVTYLNVTPAPETWDVLAAQGYRAYVNGRALLVPLLAPRTAVARVTLAGPELASGADLAAAEIDVLRDHARWDCLSVICETETGRVPFVFGLRRRRRIVPFAYVVYCRGLESLAAHARPLGHWLARRGIFLVVVDADGRPPTIPGWFQAGYPKFFIGEHAPRPGDLAYTERAVFGV